jgi:chromosome partitioning protein
MKGSVSIDQVIQRKEGIDIIPSNIPLSGAELEFNMLGREYLLKNGIAPVRDSYDYIVIDTPPALNILTVNAYTATDNLVIPMIPEILSLLGISQLRETIDLVKSIYNPKIEVLGILLNKYDKRRLLTKDVEEMAEIIAKVCIPRCLTQRLDPLCLWLRRRLMAKVFINTLLKRTQPRITASLLKS